MSTSRATVEISRLGNVLWLQQLVARVIPRIAMVRIAMGVLVNGALNGWRVRRRVCARLCNFGRCRDAEEQRCYDGKWTMGTA